MELLLKELLHWYTCDNIRVRCGLGFPLRIITFGGTPFRQRDDVDYSWLDSKFQTPKRREP